MRAAAIWLLAAAPALAQSLPTSPPNAPGAIGAPAAAPAVWPNEIPVAAPPSLPGLAYNTPVGTGTLRAGSLHREEAAGRWIASGGVEIQYRQYTLKGDMGDYDDATETATLRGNVSLDTGRNVILGGDDAVLTFHFPDRAWTFNQASTEIQPQGLLEPVFVRAETLSGTRDRIGLRGVRLTTCAPGQPQYEVSAREVTVIPDRKIIARRATFTLFGRRLVTLPALVLPIRRDEADRPPVVPVLGQSTEEGVFLKTSLNYAGARGQSGAAHVDLMQKQGLGLGLTHDDARGTAAVYGVLGRGARNVSANLRRSGRVLGFTTNVQGELRRNSYMYLPGTTSHNAGITMTRNVLASQTGITFRWDGTRGAALPYGSFAAGLTQAYRFTQKGNAVVRLDLTRHSAGGAGTKELASRADVTQAFPAVDVAVAVNHLATLAGQASTFKPVERLPELSVRTDAYRLGLTRSKSAPVALQVATGHFEANGKTGDRQLFEATAPSRVWKAGSTRLTLGGGFRQAVYASNAALYTVTGNAAVTQPIGHASDVTLAWSVQRPRGYTPFLFDRPFAYNTVTASAKVGAIRWLEMRAGSGYDFRDNVTPWRDLMGFVKVEPGPGFRLLTNVAVNVNGRGPGERSHWRYVNSALRLRLGRFHFDGEGRYLPGTRNFGRLLGNLDTPVGARWHVRALAGQDAGQRYRRVMVAKDLGCLEASVAMVDDRGWRTERGFRVMLRIKAFPVADPFSTGMFGESLDVGAPDISFGGVTQPGPTDPYL